MKNCLAFFGLIFLLILGGLGLLLFLIWVDAGQEPVIDTNVSSPAVVEKMNLADSTPVPTITPAPTPTPIPDPVAYRTRVILRAGHFSTALEAFYRANDKLLASPDAMTNELWQAEMRTTLDEFVSKAVELGEAGTAPPEYRAIDDWLKLVGPEAQKMADYYWWGVESGNQQYFYPAGESLENITNYMEQAQVAMIAAGWEP